MLGPTALPGLPMRSVKAEPGPGPRPPPFHCSPVPCPRRTGPVVAPPWQRPAAACGPLGGAAARPGGGTGRRRGAGGARGGVGCVAGAGGAGLLLPPAVPAGLASSAPACSQPPACGRSACHPQCTALHVSAYVAPPCTPLRLPPACSVVPGRGWRGGGAASRGGPARVDRAAICCPGRRFPR